MNSDSVAPERDARNNQRLRELVEASGLTQAAALAAFNATLGPRPLAFASWQAYFVKPESTRWRPFNDKLLAHAEKVFGAKRKRR